MQPKLLIVDGHSYAYRAFFAIRRLTSPSGQPTNAIYGFIRMLDKAQAQVQPSHILVVWDGGLASERMALLPEYKAQRLETPADLQSQLDHIVAYLHAANLSSWMKRGIEADDCIAAMTRRAVEAGDEVVIASSDKDFMQLVSPSVHLLNPQAKSEALTGVQQVRAKTGVDPEQIVDWLSLVGDSVDNIDGVQGIGPKTATDLLRQFGSVSDLYKRLAEVGSARLRQNLEKSAQLVRRNQQLVRLNTEVACDLPLEAMALKKGEYETLRNLFAQWGFKTLLQELESAQVQSEDFFGKSTA
jgi:DNA polymerase-1